MQFETGARFVCVTQKRSSFTFNTEQVKKDLETIN